MSQNEAPSLFAKFAVISTFLVSILQLFPLASFARGSSISGSSSSSGGKSSSGFLQRASLRETKRWTLQEWLEQKNQNALMDQWLMMNSPSPFEFMLGGATIDYKSRIENPFSETTFSSSSGEFAAYAQAVGLSVEYENNLKETYNDVSGLLNFRILGNSLQSTSLTLAGGQRTRSWSSATPEKKVTNTFAQVSVQAYLTKYFGLDGFYRNYFPVSHETLGQITGSRAEAGIFIDYKAFRVFGSWFQDVESQQTTTATSIETKRTGTKTGIKIFF
jgi:hypothetical protein